MNIKLSLDERRRYKLHGRKKGFLKARDEGYLEEKLPELILVGGEDKAALLQQFPPSEGKARLWLEIGFGNGEFLAHMAALHPQDRFIGVDVFLEGVSALLRRLERQGSSNVRVALENANIVLLEKIPANALDRVVINFPDPWPKKRHHKRRLIQKEFLDLLFEKMRSGAEVSLATDWEEYAWWMLEHLNAHSGFSNSIASGGFAQEPDDWLETSFQRKGKKAGRPARHLLFARI